jgi:hypothetical protein
MSFIRHKEYASGVTAPPQVNPCAELPPVKREYKTGPVTVFDQEYGQYFSISLPCTSYTCPHCGHILHADFWSQNVRIGPGYRKCVQCGEGYDDGSREWPQLPFSQKLRYCFPPVLRGICGGFLLAVAVVLFVPQRDWRLAVAGLGIASFPWLLWCLVRLPWVLLSIRRYNKSVSSFK